MQTSSCVRIVFTTESTPDAAARLGRTLVEEGLAACATLLPAAQSIYRWQGVVECATETLLLLKTSSEHLHALETRLHQLHSYQIPEFLAVDVDRCSDSYCDWLLAALRSTN